MPADNQEQGGRARWRRRLEFSVGQILRRLGPSRKIAEPRQVDAPRGNAILLRGVSWSNDPTFERLESTLPDEAIGVTRFSYKGPESPNYEPFDTITDMGRLVDHLERYIRRSPDHLPLYLLGHSLGGVVIASWICRFDPPTDHQQLLNKIDTVFFFAAPLFPPYPWITLFHPKLKRKVDYYFPSYDYRPLLSIFPRVVVIWADEDRIAPYDVVTLRDRDPQNPQSQTLDEVKIPGKHDNICNHAKAREVVMRHIQPGR